MEFSDDQINLHRPLSESLIDLHRRSPMMVPPPPPQQQFLSTVLSQRGPSALPYAEEVKWVIRNQLVSLSGEFPSLHPKTGPFTHNDGRTVTLLHADGTVPMIFHNQTYNIPVVIWLLHSFPNHPPLVYLNPTPDMVIKRPHPFVNPSGAVSIPYLHNWLPPSSNLVQLARHLGECFSRDPPLYSQRRLPQSPSPSPVQNSSFGISAAIPPRTYPPSPYGTTHSSSFARTEDPTEVFRRNAIDKIVESVHSDVGAMRKAREGEMEGMFGVQAVLREREEALARGVREMQAEKEGLEHKLQMVLMNADVLEGWVRENEGKVVKMNIADVDESFEPLDGLSKQMLDCTASDLAIEDVVYSQDKAVQEGVVPFGQYLRSVRMLSREQFFHRAMTSKVRAAQMQAQIGSMAARVRQHAL